MALSIALHAVSAENSNTATHSALLPSTVAAGNLLELRVSSNDVCIFKAPTGWSLTAEHTEGNSAGAIFHKIADGSEAGTYVTFTTRDTGDTTDVLTQTAHLSTVVIDWNGNLANDIAFSIPGHTSSTNPDANAVTPPWGAEDTLFIVSSHIRRGTSQTVDTYPTGYTDNQLVSATTTGSGGAQVAIASRILNAASNDPDPFSLSASTNAISYVTAIRPVQVNTDPQLDTPEPDFSVASNATGEFATVAGNMSDPDGDTLTHTIVSGAPAGLTMNADGGLVSSGSLTEGAYTITYQGDDGRGGTVQDTFVLTVTAAVFQIDSATAGPLRAGDVLTITHSNASPTGKLYRIDGQAITEQSQSDTTSTIIIPDIKTFGTKTTGYNEDILIEVIDGADTDSVTRQIAPSVNDEYGMLTAKVGAWSLPPFDPVPLNTPTYVVGDGAVDIGSGSFEAGYTYTIYFQDVHTDDLWSDPPLTFNVPDAGNEPPVITLLGQTVLTIALDSTYNDAGATANDAQDGNVTGDIVVTGTVDPTTLGTYYLNYDVTDSDGNAATTVQRTVHVTDQTVPVITLLGDSVVHIDEGDTYNDAGATASDNVDGNITGSIAVSGDTVDPNTVGTYYIRYDVTDAAGNVAAQVVRTVHVNEVIVLPPVQPPSGDIKHPFGLRLGLL